VRRIYAKEEVCIGCRLCEIHCQVEHSASRDIIKTFKKEIPSPSRVAVEEKEATSFALQCRHCSEPFCAYACITGAIRQDLATGEIVHDPEKCIGCWTCVLLCPRNAIRPDLRGPRVAVRCDLCPGREIPACIEFCPNDALYEVQEES